MITDGYLTKSQADFLADLLRPHLKRQLDLLAIYRQAPADTAEGLHYEKGARIEAEELEGLIDRLKEAKRGELLKINAYCIGYLLAFCRAERQRAKDRNALFLNILTDGEREPTADEITEANADAGRAKLIDELLNGRLYESGFKDA